MNLKKIILIVFFGMFLITGCQESEVEQNELPNETESISEDSKEKNDLTEKTDDELKEEPLSIQNSDYSEEELEYARVWLQVMNHTEVSKVTAYKIEADEPVNAVNEISVLYPHDVIRLGGDETADGIITYRKIGEGTIELYDVPAHWPGPNELEQSVKEYTQDIINNTTETYITSGKNKEVKGIIEKLEIYEW